MIDDAVEMENHSSVPLAMHLLRQKSAEVKVIEGESDGCVDLLRGLAVGKSLELDNESRFW